MFLRPFYKMLLNQEITLEDLESVDTEYFNSLCYIRDNDPEPLELTFQVEEEKLGETVSKELKPGGESIAVTEKNKLEYIDAVLKWRFVDRYDSIFYHFVKVTRYCCKVSVSLT